MNNYSLVKGQALQPEKLAIRDIISRIKLYKKITKINYQVLYHAV